MTNLKRIEVKLRIAASPEDVLSALTQSDELVQWFCEEADVQLSEKRYDFWGKFTPESPDQDQGQHTLLAAETNQLLKFRWHFRGIDSTVTYQLATEGNQTNLTLIHEDVVPYQPGQYAVCDFWSLSLENLRSWLERKKIGIRCDFATIPRGDVQLSIDIDASKESVFKSLIEPSELNRYIAEEARIEPHVDGDYDFGWDEGPLKILDIVPNEKLAYSWVWEEELKTVATWTLKGSGGKTHLTLVHSGFGPDRLGEDYVVGWLHFVNRIKFMVEVGSTWGKPLFVEADY